MDWNHRVVRVKDGDETFLMLAEVYYNDDGTPSGYSECFMHGDDMGELRQLVNRLADAVTHPVIDASEMKHKPSADDEELTDEELDEMALRLKSVLDIEDADVDFAVNDNARMSVPDECPLCGNPETCKECK